MGNSRQTQTDPRNGVYINKGEDGQIFAHYRVGGQMFDVSDEIVKDAIVHASNYPISQMWEMMRSFIENKMTGVKSSVFQYALEQKVNRFTRELNSEIDNFFNF